MPRRPLETNEDLVLNLMTFSKFGSLGQAFIVHAIRNYAEQIATKPAPLPGPDDLFDPALWQRVAADVKARCDDFYSDGRPATPSEAAASTGSSN